MKRMKRMTRHVLQLVAVVLLAAIGCTRCTPGELAVPVDTVIAEYNADASRIPRLWARAAIAMKLDGLPFALGSIHAPPSGLICLRKAADPLGPHDFFLRYKEATEEIARVGISTRDGVYYSWNLPSGSGWHGRLALAGAEGLEVPIDPGQILSVLGICELPGDRTRLPLVAQTISTDPCAYVLTVLDRQPLSGRILFRREIYFDRRQKWTGRSWENLPRRPFRVCLLDDRGRRIMTADLSEYESIERDDPTDDTPPPQMPTNIKLTWHETGEWIHLKLSEMTTEDKVPPEGFYHAERMPQSLRGKSRLIDAHLPLPRSSHRERPDTP